MWDCVVDGGTPARALPALGVFSHEAVAVDRVNRQIFLAEDVPIGAFFRFVPSDTDWSVGSPRAELAR